MKKLISTIATFALTSSAALPLIACSPDDSLKIAFVPSKDAIKVMNIVKPLEGLLKNKIKELDPEFNRSVKITTTTDYQAAGQALQDGKMLMLFYQWVLTLIIVVEQLILETMLMQRH